MVELMVIRLNWSSGWTYDHLVGLVVIGLDLWSSGWTYGHLVGHLVWIIWLVI